MPNLRHAFGTLKIPREDRINGGRGATLQPMFTYRYPRFFFTKDASSNFYAAVRASSTRSWISL
jgi:hypothetical protein